MVAELRAQLPTVAEEVVAAVISEVPSYADPFRGRMGRTIETAVGVALDGFLDLASRVNPAGQTQIGQVYDAAYALGRGEARSGRSMDDLVRAYRVGARVAWRDLSETAARGGMAALALARFAELVFTYIDELSAASVTGHTDELASSGRLRQRRLERLFAKLVEGAAPEELVAAAAQAEWAPVATLTAVLLLDAPSRTTLATLDPRTLQSGEEVPGLEDQPDAAVLLVPDAGGRSRPALLRSLAGVAAVVGPAVEWTSVSSSYLRALAAQRMGLGLGLGQGLGLGPGADGAGPVDTDEHLPALVIGADQGALADLRARALAPLNGLSPLSREKLTQTLRAWLLHHGRRDEVAAALFVHPQTVRYRMGQLRTLFGDRLDDPHRVLELTVALA